MHLPTQISGAADRAFRLEETARRLHNGGTDLDGIVNVLGNLGATRAEVTRALAALAEVL